MQHDWFGDAFVVVLSALFLLMAVVVMRKMRARRLRDYGEDTTPELKTPAPAAPPRQPVPAARQAEPTPEAQRKATQQAAKKAEAVAEIDKQATKQVEAPRQAAPEAAEPAQKAVEKPKAEPAVDAALQAGLAKTQAGFLGRINAIFKKHVAIDVNILDELEEVLLTADVGVGMATRFIDDLRKRIKAKELTTAEGLRDALRSRLSEALASGAAKTATAEVWAQGPQRPKVILFVGVNGVGKTTTIGKIASQLRGEGKSVLLAAGDTFRAAAAEQLNIWAERTGARIVRGDEGADPASVMFNAVESAKQHDVDVVLADTAGRLHTKTELMDEIKKVQRAVGKARPEAPDETWLVVDATTGQNALQQAREFNQALGLTGVILTKLDGTAKGGVVVAIVDALKIPIRYIGVGETAADLRPFSAESFIAALFNERTAHGNA